MAGAVDQTEGMYKLGEADKDSERLTCLQLSEKLAPSLMGHHNISARTCSLESLAHLQGIGNSAAVCG